MQVRMSVVLRGALVGAALLSLTACVTNSGGETATTNPSSVAPTFAAMPPKPGFGVAYVGRPSGRNVSLFPVPIELDGQPLASIGPGRYVRVELPPGPHVVNARGDWWSHAINGKAYPANFTVEPGKVYYLLPKRWLGPPQNNIAIVGSAVVPHQTVALEGTFSVQASTLAAAPPSEFLELTATELQQ